MGNGIVKLAPCLFGEQFCRTPASVTSVAYDDELGHAFAYLPSGKTPILPTISGATVSANSATALSTSLSTDSSSDSAVFQSSASFFSCPLLYSASLRTRPHRAYGKTLRWAKGKAGEDRVHLVLSEERGFLFVGIYDGFNGPDATDYLLSNLFPAAQRELNHLLRHEKGGSSEDGHSQILKALNQALWKTEEGYLDIADNMVLEHPELSLMGSCVLVMVMMGKDVYFMNVGDSRAVLAQSIKDQDASSCSLSTRQITSDHSTCVKEEVRRIKEEHPDDVSAIANDRVKGHLYHHELAEGDKFLILSSDGLYQYFTNEEAVAEVEQFVRTTPGGDPAKHLVEQVLRRAAKKAGQSVGWSYTNCLRFHRENEDVTMMTFL
ncbi:hypothetical protein HPP92_017525 [Vanilla planifolia]|uniref:protein-serine/threonine phosphatase n=1 Tax=Vanilla planifolia TaxID=51239 RepID=A0A835Q965_VANPL|nr:hypothetical protein HPP92_018125 [Vanilla planifolia]KAG0468197.1 hypothetical protein HPP92_017525 [Vanilla planifolia]